MIKKMFIILIFIYSAQIIFSYCSPCDCPEPSTYEIYYESFKVNAVDISGFDNVITDSSSTIYKLSFGLVVEIDATNKKIALNDNIF